MAARQRSWRRVALHGIVRRRKAAQGSMSLSCGRVVHSSVGNLRGQAVRAATSTLRQVGDWVGRKGSRRAALAGAAALAVTVACLGVVLVGPAARHPAQGSQEEEGEEAPAKPRSWTFPPSLEHQTARDLDDLGTRDPRVAEVLDRLSEYEHIGSGSEHEEVKLLRLLAHEPAARDFVRELPDRYPQEQADPYDQVATEGVVPVLYQWDQRWAYTQYCGMEFGATGCCPTAMSMVYMAVTGKNDVTPPIMGRLATAEGYADADSGTYGNFVDFAARHFGLPCREIGVSREGLLQSLGQGCIVVASMGPGDFTDGAHYIVITGVAEDGGLTIHDPYSKLHTEQSWDIQTILSQARRMHAFQLPRS